MICLTSNRSFISSIDLSPKHIFNEDYPVDPKTFGEKLRKARMNAGLKIKKLAELIGVTLDTVINWELKGMRPLRKSVMEKVELLLQTKL